MLGDLSNLILLAFLYPDLTPLADFIFRPQVCPAGNFSNSVASRECTPCLPSTYKAVSGTAQCSPCPEGTYNSLYGQTTCSQCPPDTPQSPSGSGSVLNCTSFCLAGTYGAFGAPPCTPCSPGSVAPLNGSATCTPCDIGSYQEQPGGVECTACIGGNSTVGKGSTLPSHCRAVCPSGSFGDDGLSPNGFMGGCTQCSPGYM